MIMMQWVISAALWKTQVVRMRSRERRARERREGGERRLGREAERMTGKPVARSVDCETQQIDGGDTVTSTHHSWCHLRVLHCRICFVVFSECEVDQCDKVARFKSHRLLESLQRKRGVLNIVNLSELV